MTTAAEVRTQILAFVNAMDPTAISRHDLPDDFDLRRDGAIDSLRFIQLLADLEARTGRTIDLVDLPAEQLMHLDVLSRHIADQLNRSPNPRP